MGAEPRTAAGRAVLGMHLGGGDPGGSDARAILAIEAEAVAAYKAEHPDLDVELRAARETIEAMSGDAADLHDLIGEAAAMRTVLGHLLNDRGRIHDSGCGICDAGRALLTADHELPARLREAPDGR